MIPLGLVTTRQGDVRLRRARPADVPVVTELIRHAYGRWTGFTSLGARQTEELTTKHLLGAFGIVGEADGEIVATITLVATTWGRSEDAVIVEKEYGSVLTFTGDGLWAPPTPTASVFFEKMAVSDAYLRGGLGTSLVALAEQAAREAGHLHVLCDAVPEAAWLYDWYLARGYRVLGERTAGEGALRLHLLAKDVEPT